MSSRKKIEDRIRKKEEEIQRLEDKMREARAYMQALQDVMKFLPRDEGAPAESILRPGSAVTEAREIILRTGMPVHISDILAGLGREDTRKNRAAIAGSLAAYVRRGEIFNRPAPNTFGLVEFRETELTEGGAGSAQQPPPEFGTAEDDEVPF